MTRLAQVGAVVMTLLAASIAGCGLVIGDYEIGDAGSDRTDGGGGDDAAGDDAALVDAGPMTVDLTPPTGMRGNTLTQTVAYFVRFNDAVTLQGIEFRAAPGAVGDEWVTHVWDVGFGSVLATGSNVFAPSGAEAWFHSNISFSAARNTQYVIGVHKISGNAFYDERRERLSSPAPIRVFRRGEPSLRPRPSVVVDVVHDGRRRVDSRGAGSTH